jgi:hypothetical protein
VQFSFLSAYSKNCKHEGGKTSEDKSLKMHWGCEVKRGKREEIADKQPSWKDTQSNRISSAKMPSTDE